MRSRKERDIDTMFRPSFLLTRHRNVRAAAVYQQAIWKPW
jgi:hypothetical protein